MDSEFWGDLQAEAWRVLSGLGDVVGAWLGSDTGRVTLLGIAAGLIAGWTVARLYFRRLRRELDPLVKRLETGTVHLETSIDRLQAEIVVANRQLDELLHRQTESRRKPKPVHKTPEPIPDFGNDWAKVGSSVDATDTGEEGR